MAKHSRGKIFVVRIENAFMGKILSWQLLLLMNTKSSKLFHKEHSSLSKKLQIQGSFTPDIFLLYMDCMA